MAKLKSMEKLFKGWYFEKEIIILCVRWYLRYKLSYRDLVEMMAERRLEITHTSFMCWVPRYAQRCAKPEGKSLFFINLTRPL